jgi:hypothetical protein
MIYEKQLLAHQEMPFKDIFKFIWINNIGNDKVWGIKIKLTKDSLLFKNFYQHVNAFNNFPYIPLKDFSDFNNSKHCELIIAAFTKKVHIE